MGITYGFCTKEYDIDYSQQNIIIQKNKLSNIKKYLIKKYSEVDDELDDLEDIEKDMRNNKNANNEDMNTNNEEMNG